VPDLISIGECMVEFFADEDLSSARTLTRSFGGDTLNTLVAAARLGTSTGYITRVGDDPFGPGLLASWQAEGVDISPARLVPGFNGIYFISVSASGERQFTYYRAGSAASSLDEEDLDPGYIAAARILHASGISQAISTSARRAVRVAFSLAREHGVRTCFDPNLRTKLWTIPQAARALQEVLPLVDIMLPSAPEDTGSLLGTADPAAAIDEFWAHGVAIVVVKQGAEGVLVGWEGQKRHVPAYRTDRVLDTTGAGDAFNGAFLHGLCAGLDPFAAARWGCVTAGLKVRGRGAVNSLPRREEVEAALAAGSSAPESV